MHLTKRTILELIVLTLFIGGLGYLYLSPQEQEVIPPILPADTEVAEPVQEPRSNRPDITGPDNWRTYWSDQWQIGFKYPQTWLIEERRFAKEGGEWKEYCPDRTCGELRRIIAVGDGYQMQIDKLGRGSGITSLEGYTQPLYILDGYSANSLQEGHNEGYRLKLAVYLENERMDHFFFRILTPDRTKKVLDEILSTIKIVPQI